MKSKAGLITAQLPLFLRQISKKGSAISARRRLSTLLVLLACGPVMASQPLTEQIDHAVREYFTQRLTDMAAAKQWQGLRFTQKVFALPPDSPTEACSETLQLREAEESRPALGRQRITLICPGQPQWSIEVTAQASVFIQAVVAAQVVERGQLITPAMLSREEVPVSRQSKAFYKQIDQVAGLSAKRRLRPRQVLTQDMLATPWLVRRGERVTMAAHQGEIQAATQGEALEDGREGMVIRVKNLASGKIIDAQVIGNSAVSSTFARSQK
ncbi:flagellar basal body P-ring formation chaperone FlgA [Pseudomonas chlororaphis subsp. aurantiaca]|uniref:flagellar basal body P-ring formation chaperone FlgA n=1 Tax=Pseudomonas chlororaphis TaxID=587753 RepID=UPI0027DDB205|nr:flagellar basal body P-ring formation chaperone FlgA [Pseudomonas chlororaphis]WMI97599.1 flagellar basal body P-ring formation chaperone FlgA [Pseudomonas chlororaphis subsp. aurantiaca]